MIEFQQDVSLKPYNTFGITARAAHFFEFTRVEDLKNALAKHSAKDKLLILGGGSNLLLTSDFDGLVLKNGLRGIELVSEDENHAWVKAMAGENWHRFVMHCIERGWAGVENLSLIPGTVGAAPMQNIGAYGVEVEQVFESLEAVEIATNEIHTFDHAACEFGYRESIFKRAAKGQYVIISVLFKLNQQAQFNTSYGAIRQTLEAMNVKELSLRAVSDAVIKIRQRKLPDPAKIGNAGSFFKNPTIDKADYKGLRVKFPSIPGYQQPGDQVKIPAAWLIEQAGWKGLTFGKIGVHQNQPLVLVNYGEGKGADLKALACKIRASVAEKFGIELSPEVNIIF